MSYHFHVVLRCILTMLCCVNFATFARNVDVLYVISGAITLRIILQNNIPELALTIFDLHVQDLNNYVCIHTIE